jgi:hypothetical protein
MACIDRCAIHALPCAFDHRASRVRKQATAQQSSQRINWHRYELTPAQAHDSLFQKGKTILHVIGFATAALF